VTDTVLARGLLSPAHLPRDGPARACASRAQVLPEGGNDFHPALRPRGRTRALRARRGPPETLQERVMAARGALYVGDRGKPPQFRG
jgi:hypothetical protein